MIICYLILLLVHGLMYRLFSNFDVVIIILTKYAGLNPKYALLTKHVFEILAPSPAISKLVVPKSVLKLEHFSLKHLQYEIQPKL